MAGYHCDNCPLHPEVWCRELFFILQVDVTRASYNCSIVIPLILLSINLLNYFLHLSINFNDLRAWITRSLWFSTASNLSTIQKVCFIDPKGITLQLPML